VERMVPRVTATPLPTRPGRARFSRTACSVPCVPERAPDVKPRLARTSDRRAGFPAYRTSTMRVSASPAVVRTRAK
jgi:hypothetical protein